MVMCMCGREKKESKREEKSMFVSTMSNYASQFHMRSLVEGLSKVPLEESFLAASRSSGIQELP